MAIARATSPNVPDPQKGSHNVICFLLPSFWSFLIASMSPVLYSIEAASDYRIGPQPTFLRQPCLCIDYLFSFNSVRIWLRRMYIRMLGANGRGGQNYASIDWEDKLGEETSLFAYLSVLVKLLLPILIGNCFILSFDWPLAINFCFYYNCCFSIV